MSPKKAVEIGPDGMPTDKAARNIALRLRFKLDNAPYRGLPGKPRFVLQQVFGQDWSGAPRAVWAALAKAGSITLKNGRWTFLQPKRLDPSRPEARAANFNAAVLGVASRAASDPSRIPAWASLFRRIRNVYGVHKAICGDCTAVLVPREIEIGPEGPRIARGFAVEISARGLRALDVPGKAVAERFEGDVPFFTLHPSLCVDDAEMQELLDAHYISPFTSRQTEFPGTVARMARTSLSRTRKSREACGIFVGEEASREKWRSFSASLARVRPLGIMFVRVLYASLDRDLRRAVMRYPVATASLYTWLCQSERRVQASSLFPVLTNRLPAAEAAIDAGRPLLPALAEATGIPVPVLRKIAGTSWQKLGKEYACLAEGASGDALSSLLHAIAPERTPVTRGEWNAAASAASALSDTFGLPVPRSLATVASRDWQAFDALRHGGLMDAFKDTAEGVRRAASGVWEASMGGPSPKASARALLAVIGADGLKRLAAFNDRWHRGEARRTASMRVLRREFAGEQVAAWKALTEGGFEHAGAVIEWLIDEDELAYEGAAMGHCVGSYWANCLAGASHIARVRAADGSRSTVEIRMKGSTAYAVQHRAERNTDPSEACAAAVEEFIKAIRNGRIATHLKPEPPGQPFALLDDMVRKKPDGPLDWNARARILALYHDCLPERGRSMNPEDWALAVAAEQRREPGQEDATFLAAQAA